MTAGLVALGDDDVGVAVGDAQGVLDVTDERDDLAVGRVDLVNVGGRVAEAGGEHGHLHARDHVNLLLRREAGGADVGAGGLGVGQLEALADVVDGGAVRVGQEVAGVIRSGASAGAWRNVRGDEDVDAEGTVGEVLDAADLLFEAIGGEPGGAEHAEPAGVGDRGDELRSGDAALSTTDGGAHAGQRDGVLDVEQVAHFGVQDGSIHGSHPRASGVLVCVSAASIVSLAGRRVNSGGCRSACGSSPRRRGGAGRGSAASRLWLRLLRKPLIAPFSSFPRRRESSPDQLWRPDSRLRGNDEHGVSATASGYPPVAAIRCTIQVMYALRVMPRRCASLSMNSATSASSVKPARTLLPEERIKGIDTSCTPLGVSMDWNGLAGASSAPSRSASIA